MRKRQFLCGLVVALLCLSAIQPMLAAKPISVTIENLSDWEIHEFYLSSVEDEEWGPDQLGQHIIHPGGSFKLTDIPCDTYDVLLVDEDGDECVVTEVDLCGQKEKWAITNEILLGCQAASE